jgi:hypothetical protein
MRINKHHYTFSITCPVESSFSSYFTGIHSPFTKASQRRKKQQTTSTKSQINHNDQADFTNEEKI